MPSYYKSPLNSIIQGKSSSNKVASEFRQTKNQYNFDALIANIVLLCLVLSDSILTTFLSAISLDPDHIAGLKWPIV